MSYERDIIALTEDIENAVFKAANADQITKRREAGLVELQNKFKPGTKVIKHSESIWNGKRVKTSARGEVIQVHKQHTPDGSPLISVLFGYGRGLVWPEDLEIVNEAGPVFKAASSEEAEKRKEAHTRKLTDDTVISIYVTMELGGNVIFKEALGVTDYNKYKQHFNNDDVYKSAKVLEYVKARAVKECQLYKANVEVQRVAFNESYSYSSVSCNVWFSIRLRGPVGELKKVAGEDKDLQLDWRYIEDHILESNVFKAASREDARKRSNTEYEKIVAKFKPGTKVEYNDYYGSNPDRYRVLTGIVDRVRNMRPPLPNLTGFDAIVDVYFANIKRMYNLPPEHLTIVESVREAKPVFRAASPEEVMARKPQPKMVKYQIPLYTFDQLDGKAKDAARNWMYERGYSDVDWDMTKDDAKQVGVDLHGRDSDRSPMKGEFMWEPDEVAKKILVNHGKDCGTYKAAKEFIADARKARGDEDMFEEITRVFLEKVLEDYRRLLIEDETYHASDEHLEEMAEANHLLFTESGKAFRPDSGWTMIERKLKEAGEPVFRAASREDVKARRRSAAPVYVVFDVNMVPIIFDNETEALECAKSLKPRSTPGGMRVEVCAYEVLPGPKIGQKVRQIYGPPNQLRLSFIKQAASGHY